MRIPRSTYRVQLTPIFRFHHLEDIVDYLQKLGIGTIYASPIFQASPNSMHGYDVTDPTRINTELGSEEDFYRLIQKAKAHNLEWLQDIVPNHMAFHGNNRILMNILESGPSSPYYHFFDIDWNHPYESINGKLLAPFLGEFYGRSLEKKQIQIRYNRDGLYIRYFQLKLPVKIDSYAPLFSLNISGLKQRLGKNHPDYIKFLGILYIFKSLPTNPEELPERSDQIDFVKELLWVLYTESKEIRRFINENIELYNGIKGNPESFVLLDNLLNEQYYSLTFWKVASEEINYKRFFTVNNLISVNVNNPDVMDFTHSLVYKLVKEDVFQGLRVDHIDGLYDPDLYLQRLHEKTDGCYTVIEKILEGEEKIPAEWKTQGPTGYGFMNKTTGIFIMKDNQKHFNRIYRSFTGVKATAESLMYDKKHLIIDRHMSGEIDNLARQLKNIAGHDRYGSDLTFTGLKEAIEEVMIYFPIYRSYFNPRNFRQMDYDIIRMGVRRAEAENPDLRFELEFLQKVLFLEYENYLSEEVRMEWLDFVMRFQQFTGPLMAKGMEDTVFYIFNRLLALNEVGSSPGIFGVSLKDFHNYQKDKLKTFPHALNASSTHDTKRGEDARARLAVLSEIPVEWGQAVKRWSAKNKHFKRLINGKLTPNRNEEYFLYQTLLATFPFDDTLLPGFLIRIKDYIIKATREAKTHTAWIKPDFNYENAFIDFVEAILSHDPRNEFFQDFRYFQHQVAFYGIFNSLSQALIKITAPGIPDFYQGSELWDLSLVDPDNRRPVDYLTRQKMLNDIIQSESLNLETLLSELLQSYSNGKIKLYLIYRALKVRNANISLFEKGRYIPLRVRGTYAKNIVAFARKYKHKWILTVVPRFLTRVIPWHTTKYMPLGPETWADTTVILPAKAPSIWAQHFDNSLIHSQNTIPVAKILAHFPAGLLEGESS